jgi:hypothetical protein
MRSRSDTLMHLRSGEAAVPTRHASRHGAARAAPAAWQAHRRCAPRRRRGCPISSRPPNLAREQAAAAASSGTSIHHHPPHVTRLAFFARCRTPCSTLNPRCTRLATSAGSLPAAAAAADAARRRRRSLGARRPPPRHRPCCRSLSASRRAPAWRRCRHLFAAALRHRQAESLRAALCMLCGLRAAAAQASIPHCPLPLRPAARWAAANVKLDKHALAIKRRLATPSLLSSSLSLSLSLRLLSASPSLTCPPSVLAHDFTHASFTNPTIQ